MKRSERENTRSSFIRIVLEVILFISCFVTKGPVEANNNVGGFSIELIHSDSLLLNPNLSHFKDHDIAFDRLESSDLVYNFGTYLMKIWYGEPPVEFLQIFDTGSDISWIQCLPCVHCYSSRYEPFNPNGSRTFKWKKCESNQTCPYSIEYKGNATSKGFLAKETIMVGSIPHRVQIENFIFGCGYENRGRYPPKSSGIIAFDSREISFITQLSSKHHGKFSFCMTYPSSSQPGRISFGDEAVVSGANVVTTPLILDGFYNVMLESITVGTKKIKNSWNHSENANAGAGKNNRGKMIVDTGTSLTFLSDSVYRKVEKAVRKQIKEEIVPCADEFLTVCYPKHLKDSEIPKFTLHFPGADLTLSPRNLFIRRFGFRCLAIAPANPAPVLGNVAMINFLVGLDLVQKTVSFKPINCSGLHRF